MPPFVEIYRKNRTQSDMLYDVVQILKWIKIKLNITCSTWPWKQHCRFQTSSLVVVLILSRYEYVTLSKVFNLTEPQLSHFPFEENDTCTLTFIHIHIHSYSLLMRWMKWYDKLLDKRCYRYLRRVTFRMTWLMIDNQNSLHFIPSWVEWNTEMAFPTNGL